MVANDWKDMLKHLKDTEEGINNVLRTLANNTLKGVNDRVYEL